MHSKLKSVHPVLAAKAEQIMEIVKKRTGVEITVAQGLRTMQQQAALYAQGRTVKGIVVTNAPAGFSPHNYGCAVDFQLMYPVEDIQRGRKILTNFPDKSPVWNAIGEAAKTVGLEWGGDWKKFKDRPHVEIPVLKYGRPLLKMVKGEDLSAVWKEADKVLTATAVSTPESPFNPDNSETWVYTVKAGDTLSGIASKLLGAGSRYAEILELNKLPDSRIFVGQVLIMPKR